MTNIFLNCGFISIEYKSNITNDQGQITGALALLSWELPWILQMMILFLRYNLVLNDIYNITQHINNT